MPTTKRVLNWRPDLPDHRDQVMSSWKPVFMLPKRVDLRPICSKVEDQGELGSCVGNAIAGAIELLDEKNLGTSTDISRLFIYYEARKAIKETYNDSGAYIRDGIKALRKVGACREEVWPYVLDKFDDKPSPEAYADALDRKFNSYWRLQSLSAMLNCLANGYPFVFGFSVYTHVMDDEVTNTGKIDLPADWEYLEGGHAVLAVGYDRTMGRIIFRNSWGESWGDGGYGTLPFGYLTDRDLSDDFWTLRG